MVGSEPKNETRFWGCFSGLHLEGLRQGRLSAAAAAAESIRRHDALSRIFRLTGFTNRLPAAGLVQFSVETGTARLFAQRAHFGRLRVVTDSSP